MSDWADTLAAMQRDHPGWAPWLGLMGCVLDEAQRDEWDEAARDVRPPAGLPILNCAAISLRGRSERLLAQLTRCAGATSAPKLRSLAALPLSRAAALFRAALIGDDGAIARIARDCGTDPEGLMALAALLPVPFLHACARRWSAATDASAHGCCPLCGAWPALAEVCGIERKRWLRCGRCGTAWPGAPLVCVYCGTRDHAALGSMVCEGRSSLGLEVCNGCKRYVKVMTKLQRSAPHMVALEDLGSIELDFAAALRGYARPRGIGRALDVVVDGAIQ